MNGVFLAENARDIIKKSSLVMDFFFFFLFMAEFCREIMEKSGPINGFSWLNFN